MFIKTDGSGNGGPRAVAGIRREDHPAGTASRPRRRQTGRDIRSRRWIFWTGKGRPHWESLRAVTAPLTSPPSGSGRMGFSTGRCGPWGSKLQGADSRSSGPVLVVGLGNRAMTPDAVGPLAADSVLITRHLIDAMPQHFSGLPPGGGPAAGGVGRPPAWSLQRRCGGWWTGAASVGWSSPWTRWPPAGWGGCAVPSSSATPASSPAAA